MAEDNLTLMIEANRRGLLPPDQKATFDEAVRRGLMPSSASGMDRFMMGVTDPGRGVMELAGQIMGKSEAKAETPDPGAKPKDVKVPGEVISPTDPMRIAGNVANPINLAPPLALSRVAGMGPMAKTITSATIPALLQPVGETNDFWGEKGKQGATGAALGYGFSVAGKGVSKGVDALGRWLVSRYPDNIMSHAVSLVLKRIEQDTKAGGLTAKNMIDMIREASKAGRPLTLADAGGKNVERLAGHVYRKGGEGGAIADQLFETRDTAAANRLRQNIAQYIHGGMTVFEATEALLTARSAAARPLYEHTDSLQGIWSPRLAEFFKDPVIKTGMARGYEMERMVSLAENRAFNPTAMGVDISDPNNITFLRAPTMRVLDMAKQGLDEMISKERNEITGRLSARGVALDKLRRGYLQTIDTLDTTGVYRKARAEWGGYSASLDALKAGRTVFAAGPEENAAFVASLKAGSGDIEFYRMGVADVLNERIAKTGFSADEAKALIKNDWMRRQLKPAFLSEGDFNGFVNSVTQESEMFARRRSITGGSQTAERLAEDQSPLIAHAQAGADIAEHAAKGKWLNVVRDFYRMYRDVGVLPDPKLNEATAKLLFSPLLPNSKTETAKAIRMLAPATPGQRPPPRNHLNYLAGPARSVQDLIAPMMASETGELSGGRPLPLPGYQEGGDAPAGQPIVVGERGPEVIVPKGDVSVIPDIDSLSIDSLLRQMGSGPAPPEADPMTRALPGYEQRSPGELAMIRTQEATRPTRGRADITPEHVAQMLVTGGSLYAGPEALTARAIAAAPKTMTGLLAALGFGTSTTEAGESAFNEPEPKRASENQSQIDAINTKINPKRTELDRLKANFAAGRIDKQEFERRRVPLEGVIGRAADDIKGIDAPFQRQLTAWEKRKNDALTAQSEADEARRQKLADAELPFRVKHPEATQNIIKGGTGLTAATAAALGLLSRGKIKPVVGATGMGAIEGAATANIPELIDMGGYQPIGSDAWWKTVGQFGSKENAIKTGSEAGLHALLAGGTSYGASFLPKIGKRLGEYGKSIKDFVGRSPSQPSPPISPPPLPTGTTGSPGSISSPSSPAPSASPFGPFSSDGQQLRQQLMEKNPQSLRFWREENTASVPTPPAPPPTIVRSGVTYELTSSGWRVQAGQSGGGRFMKKPPTWPSWLPREGE